jgi:hypothetical protein
MRRLSRIRETFALAIAAALGLGWASCSALP